LEVGLARQRRVERLEPARGTEQKRGGVPATIGREGDPGAQHLHLRALERVQRHGFSACQDRECRLGRAGLVLGLCGGERATRPRRGVDGQARGTFEERRGGGHTSAHLGAPGGALELHRHVLVVSGR
jgi:hypothetical protein